MLIIAFRSSFISLCVYSVASPLSLSWVIVLRKYVFNIPIEEANLSQVQLVIGRTPSILRTVEIFGNEMWLVSLRVSGIVSGTSS